jgi:hypothetical protein
VRSFYNQQISADSIAVHCSAIKQKLLQPVFSTPFIALFGADFNGCAKDDVLKVGCSRVLQLEC